MFQYYLKCNSKDSITSRGHPRGRFGRKSLPELADFFLFWAEGEVKMYRMYRVGKSKFWAKSSPWSPEYVKKLLPLWKL